MADIRLQGLIDNACKPGTPRFDLKLGKQICDLVNEKQGSFPRIAALKIAKLVVSKNAQQAMHALSLLNLCVLECDYPFHLQMSTDEFVNEITKRTPLIPYHNIAPAETRKSKESPEHPWNHFDYIPTQPSTSARVNERLLYMIKEWAIAFQHDALYREDMERLVKLYHCLKQLNYPFPDVSDSPLVASFTAPKLLTPDEMLEKAKMFLTTKFHEYVRRSKSPDDENTRIANDLLKSIITDEKHQEAFTKYKEERFPQMIRGIKCKAIVLYEQLEAMKPEDKIDKPMKDLHKVLCNAQTKTKRMLSDENFDLQDHVKPLDALIDKVLAKYSDIEQGIYNTSYDIFNKSHVQETTSITTTFGSLIDLEDQTSPVSSSSSPPEQMKPRFDADIPVSRTVTLIDKNGLQIHLEIYENSTDNSMKLKASFSNQSIAPMEEMKLDMTVGNAMAVTMEPASSSVIRPKSVKSVHQNIILSNIKERQLRCTYKVTYYQLGVLMEQSGEYQENL